MSLSTHAVLHPATLAAAALGVVLATVRIDFIPRWLRNPPRLPPGRCSPSPTRSRSERSLRSPC